MFWMATCYLDGRKHESSKCQETGDEQADDSASYPRHAQKVEMSPEVEGGAPTQQEN